MSMNNKLMERMMEKCISEVVTSCASMYNFDASECMKALLQNPMTAKVSTSVAKVSKKSQSFPLPFMREHVNESGCQGITYNYGLFTQCCNERSEEQEMCNTCLETNCGTVEARMSADFKDPKGRKPKSYIAVLRKLKLTQEQAIEEAGKKNIELNESHFVEQVKEKVVKPVKEKVQKEPKPVKEKVGRPKSTKKSIETVTVEDLFASLVAEEVSDNEEEVTTVQAEVAVALTKEEKKAESDAERNEREQMKAAETEQKKMESEIKKAEKAAAAAAEKEAKAAAAILAKQEKAAAAAAEKEAKAAAAAAEKEAKAAAVAAEKEAKAAAVAAEKEAKAAAKKEKEEAAKKEKEAKNEKEAKKEKETKKTKTVVAASEPAVVEPAPVAAKVTVKRITIEGKEYLISVSNNMLYEPKTKEEVGIWNSVTESIDELPEESDDEEVEDDYESDSN